MTAQDITQDSPVHKSAEAISFSVFCGEPSITEGYISSLAQQGFSHTVNARLVLILDIPRGLALQWMEGRDTTEQRVVTITWSTCAEYCEDIWDLRPHILIVGDGLPFNVAQALHDAERGLRYRRTLDHPVTLMPSERRILRLVAQGLPNQEIAARLHLNRQTIKNGLATIYQKLQVNGRSQAILYYWSICYDTGDRENQVKKSAHAEISGT